jgi:hypothetical protein
VYLKGTRQVFDPQKATAVVDAVNSATTSTVGAYAGGYAASSEEYQAAHPHVPQTHSGTIIGPDGQMSHYFSNGISTIIVGSKGMTSIYGN